MNLQSLCSKKIFNVFLQEPKRFKQLESHIFRMLSRIGHIFSKLSYVKSSFMKYKMLSLIIEKINGQTSILRGEVVGAYLSITFPSLFTRNLVKFHLMPSMINPPFCDFKYL